METSREKACSDTSLFLQLLHVIEANLMKMLCLISRLKLFIFLWNVSLQGHWSFVIAIFDIEVG